MTATPPASAASSARQFPDSFLWGSAMASYQIEGAVKADGRTPSIWDTFAATPGAVLDGDTGEVACDHYQRMPEDVALMRELDLASYRFSVAWPRIRPDGGAPNPEGIDFYSRLVDELLGNGITPWVTLYHWDLPQTLEDAGGWLNRDTAERFRDYALTVYDALGDRVRNWTTHNEPWCSAFLGYTGGQHAPGRQEGVAGVIAAHHLMLGHGLVVDELRRIGSPDDQLGITLNLTVPEPFDPTEPADVAASERVEVFWNRMFLDPLFHGEYDARLAGLTEGMRWQGRSWQDFVRDGDLALISAPLDVLGVNYYHGDAASGRSHPAPALLGSRVVHPSRPTTTPFPGGENLVFPRRGLPVTGLDWEVQPEGLTRLLVSLREDGVPPIYVTENGAAYPDVVSADGTVDDPERLAFISDHLLAIHAAIEAGVDVRGYFAWSFLDNFEWAYGYSQRFGIVHVDYETQVRTPKASALWFADVARTGLVATPGDSPGDSGEPVG